MKRLNGCEKCFLLLEDAVKVTKNGFIGQLTPIRRTEFCEAEKMLELSVV